MALPYETKRLPPGSLLDMYSESAGPIWARNLGSLQDTFIKALGMKFQADQLDTLATQKERQMELDEFKAGAAAMSPIAKEDPEAYYMYLQSNAKKYPFLGLDEIPSVYETSVLEPYRDRKDAMERYLSGTWSTMEDLQLMMNQLKGSEQGRRFIQNFRMMPKMEELKQFESSKSSWGMLFDEAKGAGMISDEQFTSAQGMLAGSGTAAHMSQVGANILNIGKWEKAKEAGDRAEAERLIQGQIDIHTKLATAIEQQVLYPRYFAEAKLRLGLSGIPDNDLNDTQTQRVSDIANQIQTERYNYHTSEALGLGATKLGIPITPSGAVGGVGGGVGGGAVGGVGGGAGGVSRVSGKIKESDKISGSDYTIKQVYGAAFKLYPDLFITDPDGRRVWNASKIKDKKHKEELLLKVIEEMKRSRTKKRKPTKANVSSAVEYPSKYRQPVKKGTGIPKEADVYLTKEQGYRVIQNASEANPYEKVFSIKNIDGTSTMYAYSPLRKVE